MLPKTKAAAFTENDLVMYLATGLKHIRLMALLVCLSLMLGTNYYVYSRSVYYCRSLIHYENLASQMDSESIWKDSNEPVMNTALAAPSVLGRTCRALGIDPSPRVLTVKYLKAIPRVRRNSEKDFIIETYAYSLAIATNWAPTLLNEYYNQREETRLEYAEKMIKRFTDSLAEAKDRMNQNTDSKFVFQQKSDLDKTMIEMSSLERIPQQIAILEHRLLLMDGVLRSVSNAPDVVSKLSLLNSLASDPSTATMETPINRSLQISVGQQYSTTTTSTSTNADGSTQAINVITPSMTQMNSIADWEGLDRERHRLQQELRIKGEHFMPGHPQMRELTRQLGDINKRLDVEYLIALDNFKLEYTNRMAQKNQLEAKIPEYQDVARRNAHLASEYANFESVANSWKAYIKNTAQRLETIDFGFDKDRVILEFKGNLDAPTLPVSPNKGKVIMLSLLMGFMLAIAVPFLMEYMSSRISDVEHAEEVLRIRGLGVVPKVTDVPFDRLLLEDEKSDHHLKESFRLIRTNLVINSDSGALPQVVLVTSSVPQEGKTCVAANLALSFASKGEKTLLIDGDLRRGRAHKLFNVEHKPGLSNLLAGQVTLDQVCHNVAHENLTVMTCGKHLNSASELLDSNKFTELMTELRGKYQRIILDTPPVLGLSETLIMQRHADGVLLVIWSEFTPLSSVKASIQALQVNGAKFAGFVLNRLDFSALTNRYKYFYYAPLYYANYQPLPAPATTGKVD